MTWVGIPFKDSGREPDGLDCWGLVRLFLQEEMGVVLPTYSETPLKDLVGMALLVEGQLASGAWTKIDRSQARRGDVVLMWTYEKLDGQPYKSRHHVGVLIEPERLLHTELGKDSVVVPLSHHSVRERLEAFWRYNQ